jgi:dihydroxyacetone kinase
MVQSSQSSRSSNIQPNDALCVLVNNLGGTSNFEMSILARSCVKLLESSAYNAKVTRVLVGSYMTSFDMHGASLTIDADSYM